MEEAKDQELSIFRCEMTETIGRRDLHGWRYVVASTLAEAAAAEPEATGIERLPGGRVTVVGAGAVTEEEASSYRNQIFAQRKAWHVAEADAAKAHKNAEAGWAEAKSKARAADKAEADAATGRVLVKQRYLDGGCEALEAWAEGGAGGGD